MDSRPDENGLFTLLANWGEEHEQLTALCDNADPLKQDQSLFDAMINRNVRVYSDAFGERHPITFNLSGPVQFCDSKAIHGIQLADDVAAAAVYVFSGADDDDAKKWRELIGRNAHYGSVLPDMEEALDLSRIEVQRNAVLLTELHSRTKQGMNLIEGMPEYAAMITELLRRQPIFVSEVLAES